MGMSMGGMQTYNEVRGTVDELARADAGRQRVGGAAEPRGEQHGIRPIGVEVPEGAIAEPALANHFAIFEGEVAEVGKLLPAVLRPGGRRKEGDTQHECRR